MMRKNARRVASRAVKAASRARADGDESDRSDESGSPAKTRRVAIAVTRRVDARAGEGARGAEGGDGRCRRVLGRGSTSVVVVGGGWTRARTAVKRVRVLDASTATQARREAAVLRAMIAAMRGDECEDAGALAATRATMDPHGGVVRCLGFAYDARAREATFTLELMREGSLDSVVRRCGAMRGHPRAAMCVLRCLSNGLAYLHGVLGVAHRDIKPSNVLVDDSGACKLSDFGLCERIEGAEGKYTTFGGDACMSARADDASHMNGTISYMSPERVLQSSPRGCEQKSDIWSVGVTILEAAIGRAVFDIEDGGPLGLVMQIVHDDIDVTGAAAGDCAASVELRRALAACLKKDHRERPSALDLISADDCSQDNSSALNLHEYSCSDVRRYLHSEELARASASPGDYDSGSDGSEETKF